MEAENITMKWKAVSLTHVEYHPGDYVGLMLAWFSLLPIFILVSLSTLVLFKRDLHTIFFLASFVVNEALNYSLKHIIKELRPFTHKVSFTEYGMPSSHAQFIAFFATYLILFFYIRLHRNSYWLHNVWKHLNTVALLSTAALVSYSRVYLLYHTGEQVVWGLFVGAVFGTVMFATIHFLLSPFFPSIVSWRLSEVLMLRDTSLIDNITWFDYCSQRTQVHNILRKLESQKHR